MWKIESIAALAALVILAGIDIKKRKVPVRVLTVLTVTVILYRMIYREYGVWQYVWGLVPGMVFCGISYVTRQALGYGDSWMILILGIYLGITDVILLLLAAFSLAAAFSAVCLAHGYIVRPQKVQKQKEFAFIPVLAVSYLGVLLL